MSPVVAWPGNGSSRGAKTIGVAFKFSHWGHCPTGYDTPNFHIFEDFCISFAISESFFATYKKELIHTRPWNGLTDVRQQKFLWIEGYYNRRRRHSTLGYLTPTEYELGYRKLTDLAA